MDIAPVVPETFIADNVVMVSITLKGLAKFMVATPAQQRKILRDYKYPKEEGQAMAQYYKEARDVIYSFHKNKHPKEWLATKLLENSAICYHSNQPSRAEFTETCWLESVTGSDRAVSAVWIIGNYAEPGEDTRPPVFD